MKLITNWLLENPYLSDTNIYYGTTFTKLLNSNIDPVSPLNEKSIVTGIIKYPACPHGWPKDLDLFAFFGKKILKKIQDKECYFIFDESAEGHSPFWWNWFEILYRNCKAYKIDPYQIIFISSNLKDEENLMLYCKQNNKKPLNLISLPFFENNFQLEDDSLIQFKKVKNFTVETYSGKYFSSLNRVKRPHRNIAQFLLYQTGLQNRALISQNKLDENDIYIFNNLFLRYPEYNLKSVKKWNKKLLPMIVDHKDFNENWAIIGEFQHIHHQTLFQLVNETLIDDINKTSLFYSEKTFRPISCFQPFIIFGQPGCNHHLKNLGYKLYDNWFDLSFDYEEDYINRLMKILNVLKDTSNKLDSMSKEQQIEWKFKSEEVLLHNYNNMKKKEISKEKIKNFILKLEEQI